MSFTSLDFSTITSEGYIVYSVASGFKVLVEDTEEGVTYFTEPSTSPLTSLGSCIMQGALLTTISGSFSGISARDRALVKVDSSWATVTSFINNNNVILDRTFDTARLCTFSGNTVTTRNNFVAGTKITFRTTAQLPTGITANTIYYVLTATAESFTFSATLEGSAISTSGGIGRHSVYRVYTVQTTTYSPDRIGDTIVAKVTRTGTSPNFEYNIEPYYSVQSDSELAAVPTLPNVGSYVGQVVLNIEDGIIYTWDGSFWVANSTEIIRSPTAPGTPTVGQLWFRTTDSLLFTWSGSEWIQVVSATPGTRYINVTTESGLYTGELVTNTVDNNLYRWDGSVWVLVSDTSILDLSNEAHTIPTDFNNTAPDFTGAETTVRVYSGGNDVTNLWTLSANPVGVTGAFGNGTNWPTNEYRISAISLDAAYVDFTATRGAYTRTARFTLSLARGGEDGVPATVFRVVPSVFAVKELNGNFTPSTITFNSYLVSSGYTAANSDFKIYTSTNGVEFTEIITYLSDRTDVSSYSLTAPNTKFLRVEIYAPGTNTLRDIETLPYISDGVNGNSGSTAIQIDLSNENASILTDINGTNINLSDAVTTVRIYEGTSDATTGWAITATPSDGVTVNNVSNTYTVTGFTGTTGFVDFTATKSGFSSLTARFSLIKVTSGNIYRVKSSVDSVVKNSAGAYLPTVVTFSSERTTVAGTASYSGRFIIATSEDGVSFTDQPPRGYTSAVDESSVAYTVPANIVAIRANLYLAGSTTTLVDSETIPIITNGTNGSNGINGRVVNLTAGTQVFTYNADGTTPTPENTVVTAAALNTTGTVFYEFLVNGSSVQNTDTPTRTVTAPTTIANTTIEVRIREGTNSSTVLATDQITVAGIRPGVNAISGFLTNETHTVFAGSSGGGYSLTGAGGTFKVFNGVSDQTTNAAFSIISTNPVSGLTINIDSAGNYSLSGVSWSSDTATFTLRAVLSGVTIDKVYSISKSRAGIDGNPGPTGPTGAQARIAYAIEASNFAFSGATSVVRSGDALPISGNWGMTTTWFTTPQTLTTNGTSLYQVTGLFDGTNTTWSGYPYLSALKVGELSAITADVGTVTAGMVRNSANSMQVDLNNGRIVFNNGTVMKVTGNGFGSTNQFLEWFGPSQAISSCTEANGIQWVKTNGSAYFGGALSIGVLTTKAATTSTATNAVAETAVFGSNGGTITVSASWVTGYGLFYYSGSNLANNSGSSTVVATLRRSINGGAYADVSSIILTRSWTRVNQGFEPGLGYAIADQAGASGSITYTDPANLAQNRQYKLEITSYPLGGSPFSINTQQLSIICSEG
jgi:hypothetical protein